MQPIRAMLNPSTPVMTTHMILAGYMATGLTIASVYAVGMLKGRRDAYHRRALAVGLTFGLVLAPVQVFVGDLAAKLVAERQPMKLAAMEGLWDTTARRAADDRRDPVARPGADRAGDPDPGRAVVAGVRRHSDAVVQGLKSVPPGDRPNTIVVHLAFQAMVAIGFALLGLGVWALVGWWRRGRRALPDGRWFLRAAAVAGPAAFIALEAGWVVTEVGRQPWIVYGQMRTAEAVTTRGGIVWWLVATVGTYVLLGTACAWLLIQLARKPRDADVRPRSTRERHRAAGRRAARDRRGDDAVRAARRRGLRRRRVGSARARTSARSRTLADLAGDRSGVGGEPRLVDLRGHGAVRGVPVGVRRARRRALRAVRHRDRRDRDARSRVRVPLVRRAGYRDGSGRGRGCSASRRS